MRGNYPVSQTLAHFRDAVTAMLAVPYQGQKEPAQREATAGRAVPGTCRHHS